VKLPTLMVDCLGTAGLRHWAGSCSSQTQLAVTTSYQRESRGTKLLLSSRLGRLVASNSITIYRHKRERGTSSTTPPYISIECLSSAQLLKFSSQTNKVAPHTHGEQPMSAHILSTSYSHLALYGEQIPPNREDSTAELSLWGSLPVREMGHGNLAKSHGKFRVRALAPPALAIAGLSTCRFHVG
jgi:hypothetical protein